MPAVPHLSCHLLHVHALPAALDRVLQTATLVSTTLLALILLVSAFRPVGPRGGAGG